MLLYFATESRWEKAWTVVADSCEALPVLLPLVFAASGYLFLRNKRDIEEGNLAYLKVCISVLNTLASLAAAFLVASITRDALISKMKFGDWSVYVGEKTPVAFVVAVMFVGVVASVLQFLGSGRIGRNLNGATFGALAGAICLYRFLPIQ